MIIIEGEAQLVDAPMASADVIRLSSSPCVISPGNTTLNQCGNRDRCG
jgi:hypothetical protein